MDFFDDDDDDLLLLVAGETEDSAHLDFDKPTPLSISADCHGQTLKNNSDNIVVSDQGHDGSNQSKQSVDTQTHDPAEGLISSLKENTQNRGLQDGDVKEATCTIPESFPFPFTPYDIQLDFMKNLYKCLELGRIGVFESPTGTGKSLSLICGALKWLRDFQEQKLKELESLNSSDPMDKTETDTEPADTVTEGLDWIQEFVKKKEQEEALEKVKNEQLFIQKRENKLKELKHSNPYVRKRKKAKLDDNFDELMAGAASDIKKACMEELEAIEKETSELNGSEDDADIVLDEYHSDEEKEGNGKDDNEEEETHITKIYYCSRTHSQIAQFVREVVKSPFEDVRVISLGSRQNMCINPAVQKLRSVTLINDKCLELKQKKSKSRPGCSFHKQDLLHVFKDKALLEISDIEQLVSVGRLSKTCPYYGARYAVPLAEIVALPYNTLLHKQTRAACGIKLEGSIVIVDEAHNLLETINNIHSIEITGAQIIKAHSQLRQYGEKYKTRLKAKNLMYVQQILFVLSHLAKIVGGKVDLMADAQKNNKEDICLFTINDFLFKSELDNLNMFKILRYCHCSRISKKLNGFIEKYKECEVKSAEKESSKSGLTKFLEEIKASNEKACASGKPEGDAVRASVWMSSPLMHIESFLDALTNANEDGRVVISRQVKVSTSSLKFLMLNPAVHFGSILQEARAVVVAGGTMQPVSEFKDQLFHAAGVSPERILEFSCGHVIPSHQLLPLALSKGPSGRSLDFTFQNRNRPEMIEELGRVVTNVCNLVPGGIVCFFPSYDYEKLVYSSWDKSSTLANIQAKKKVFREPKGSGLADQVLHEYADCIKRCSVWKGSLTGAVLLCVVGGKMSEGINFSDDLGRCVLMVGLPYPNIHSPELKEKMRHLNATFPRDQGGKQAGQVHYENLCMKAVNQSIGRAIRHKSDYASILLMDQRYHSPSIISQLPTWIAKRVQKCDSFNTLVRHLPKFFAENEKICS